MKGLFALLVRKLGGSEGQSSPPPFFLIGMQTKYNIIHVCEFLGMQSFTNLFDPGVGRGCILYLAKIPFRDRFCLKYKNENEKKKKKAHPCFLIFWVRLFKEGTQTPCCINIIYPFFQAILLNNQIYTICIFHQQKLPKTVLFTKKITNCAINVKEWQSVLKTKQNSPDPSTCQRRSTRAY